MKASAILFGVVLLAAAGGAAWYFLRGGTVTITVSQQQIEERLAQRFPLKKTYLQALEIVYENPRVKLTEGSDRIGIGVDARVDLPLTGADPKGAADVLTGLAYDAQKSAFVLHDPKLDALRIDGLDAKIADKAKEIANLLAVEQLPGIPVYTLQPTDTKRIVARATLRRVTVRDGKVVLELGL
jgi:hypothetical protein